MATVSVRSKTFAIIDWNEAQKNDHISAETNGKASEILCLKFDTLQEEHKYLRIWGARLYVYIADGVVTANKKLGVYGFEENVSIEQITYGNAPNSSYVLQIKITAANAPGYYNGYSDYSQTDINLADAMKNGICINTDGTKMQTCTGENAPYIELRLEDEIVGLQPYNLSPPSGAFVDKDNDLIFSWMAKQDDDCYCYEEVAAQSAKIVWENETGEEHTIIATDPLWTVIPAGTFTGERVKWKVELTSTSGATSVSDWAEVTTQDAIPETVAINPKGTVVDGSNDIKFEWEHIISTGTKQKSFELQISGDGTNWEILRNLETSDNFVIIPADTLHGTIYWRVRTANTNGIYGEWSADSKIIVIAAPATPKVIITSVQPRFEIRWEQGGQEAYEIALDGEKIRKKYSRESHCEYDDYLAPGNYTVSVRIQNEFRLWSEWGSTVISIVNETGPEIQLQADENGKLLWTSSSEYIQYSVFRDDEIIAKTKMTAYKDEFAVGTSKYMVRGEMENGNYTESNEVSITTNVPCMMISYVHDPKWLHLRHSVSSLRTVELSASSSATYVHYVGERLPSVEVGDAINMQLNFETSMRLDDTSLALEFEKLLGKLVCIKTKNGERYVGVLDSISRKINAFCRSYTASATLVNWREQQD